MATTTLSIRIDEETRTAINNAVESERIKTGYDISVNDWLKSAINDKLVEKK